MKTNLKPQPLWLDLAYKSIGLKEVPGVATHPTIKQWLIRLDAWWKDDETPWCGVFIAFCMKEAGFTPPKNYFRAKEWMSFGVECKPEYGAIAVLGRDGGGHVGFVIAVAPNGDIQLLGGNQSNAVTKAWFKKDRVLGFRKPSGATLSALNATTKAGAFSKTEA